jgi:hypothetical protein
MQKPSLALAALISAVVVGTAGHVLAGGAGYKDTPKLPDQPWLVHDSDRPVPHIVTPGATFSHGAPAPSDAAVLFDGTDLSQWKSDKGAAGWKVENGYMEVVKDSGNIRTKAEFGDFQLHLEFATPAKVEGNSQGRGNSGVLIYGRYEVQVLDSYENPTYPDGQVGAMYGQFPPLATAPKKPGEWQSYDIIFEAPRWDENQTLTKRANVTVLLNGVVLHHKKEYIGDSVHREVGKYHPHPPRGPIMLQEHHNPTRFRNIWIRNLGEYDKP